MTIVVLDGHTLNPGDLSWAALEALAPCTVYDRTAPADVSARAAAAEIVLTNKTVLALDALNRLPQLQYIGVLATGYNVVDMAAARERGILVTNVPAYGTPAVAQMVFAHLLHLAQHAAEHGETVVAGDWCRAPDFCYWRYPLVELAGLTMGIVGLGRIGCAVAGLAQAFGMHVLAADPMPPECVPTGVTLVDLDALFAQSDVVSLHCPLTDKTRELVNENRLGLMKPSAFLINTSRGPLVDEVALARALNDGGLAGAGLDVLSVEPPELDNPLLRAANCTITPHIAWATRAARQRLMDVAVGNVQAFLAGQPRNVVG